MAKLTTLTRARLDRGKNRPKTVLKLELAAVENIRTTLNDRIVRRLPFADAGQYAAYDEELKGFYLLIGRKSRRYMVRGDLRADGRRTATVKVSVGDASEISASKARTIATGYLAEIRQGRHPKPDDVRPDTSVSDAIGGSEPAKDDTPPDGPTLLQAWESYKAALVRKERSERTIAGYEAHILGHLRRWRSRPVKELAENPRLVSRKHNAITRVRGSYAANGAMRTLRAVYNHAWKNNKKVLPRDNPVETVEWNKEHRRNTGMGLRDLPRWFEELAALENEIRREFHLFTLLSSSRPAALKAGRLENLDWTRRVLHIPRPKGGEDRAFDIPLSRQMIRCLVRVVRLGRAAYPLEAQTWLFPAASTSGHIAETKEDRDILSKWGNDLRQTYRTLAAVAGVSAVDAKLLMNHAIPGVNEGYITREKIVEDHLRAQQQAISDVIFKSIQGATLKPGALRNWLGFPGTRIVDAEQTSLEERRN